MDAALTCATRAFDEGPWPRMPAVERGRVLLRAADLLRARADEFVACDVANAGKPVASAQWEVEATASTFEYYGGAANKVGGDVPPDRQARPGRRPAGAGRRLRPDRALELPADDRGLEGGARPWPVATRSCSSPPATRRCRPCCWARCWSTPGSRPTPCRSCPAPGATVGDVLVGDPRVHKISFTGETTTGTRILQQSAPNIARVALELGGKSPCLVFADADLDRAAEELPMAVFDNAGQDCCARARVLVERAASTTTSSPPSPATPRRCRWGRRRRPAPRWGR